MSTAATLTGIVCLLIGLGVAAIAISNYYRP